MAEVLIQFDDVAGAPETASILDPFSVYRKGEAMLRGQLSALAGWHLVNIIRHYCLSPESSDRLAAREPDQLVEMIVDAVRTPQSTRQGLTPAGPSPEQTGV